METRKLDRRTSRTKRMLRDSLLDLILEKGYQAVTIEDITERADLGRTTFYLHYRDKEELLLESIYAMVDDLIETVFQIPLEHWAPAAEHLSAGPTEGVQTSIRLIFEHAAKNADLYRIILSGEGRSKAVERLRETIIHAANDFIELRLAQERPSFHSAIPLDVFSNYFAGALLGSLTWWLENDLPYPPQHMAEMFESMFLLGARQALGLSMPGS